MYQVAFSNSQSPAKIVKYLFPGDSGCGENIKDFQEIGEADILLFHRGPWD